MINCTFLDLLKEHPFPKKKGRSVVPTGEIFIKNLLNKSLAFHAFSIRWCPSGIGWLTLPIKYRWLHFTIYYKPKWNWSYLHWLSDLELEKPPKVRIVDHPISFAKYMPFSIPIKTTINPYQWLIIVLFYYHLRYWELIWMINEFPREPHFLRSSRVPFRSLPRYPQTRSLSNGQPWPGGVTSWESCDSHGKTCELIAFNDEKWWRKFKTEIHYMEKFAGENHRN